MFAAVKAFKTKFNFSGVSCRKVKCIYHFPICAQRIPQRKQAELGGEYAKQIGLLIE
jgi:hypothetical protein